MKIDNERARALRLWLMGKTSKKHVQIVAVKKDKLILSGLDNENNLVSFYVRDETLYKTNNQLRCTR